MACTDESHAPLVAVIETALPGRRVVGPLRPVDNGFCNDVYFAELEPDEHIVLRVTRTTDGLQKWRTYKTRNEVAVLKAMKSRTSIPVPDVLAFHVHDADTCAACTTPEFIIMNRCPGVPLNTIWDGLDHAARRPWLDQLTDVVVKLRRFTFPAVGGFTSSDLDPAAIVRHADVPCMRNNERDVARYYAAAVETYVNHMPHHPHADLYAPLQPRLRAFCDEVLPRIVRDSGGAEAAFVLSHLDLSPKNILVDPASGTLTAVLDWEWSGSYPADAEFAALGDFASTQDDMRAVLARLADAGVVKPPGFDARAPVRRASDLAMTLVSYQAWFSKDPAAGEHCMKDALRELQAMLDEHGV